MAYERDFDSVTSSGTGFGSWYSVQVPMGNSHEYSYRFISERATETTTELFNELLRIKHRLRDINDTRTKEYAELSGPMKLLQKVLSYRTGVAYSDAMALPHMNERDEIDSTQGSAQIGSIAWARQVYESGEIVKSQVIDLPDDFHTSNYF